MPKKHWTENKHAAHGVLVSAKGPRMTPQRKLLIDTLKTLGPVEDNLGRASLLLCQVMAQGGYAGNPKTIANFLNDAEVDGIIVREVRGKRTYRIALAEQYAKPTPEEIEQDRKTWKPDVKPKGESVPTIVMERCESCGTEAEREHMTNTGAGSYLCPECVGEREWMAQEAGLHVDRPAADYTALAHALLAEVLEFKAQETKRADRHAALRAELDSYRAGTETLRNVLDEQASEISTLKKQLAEANAELERKEKQLRRLRNAAGTATQTYPFREHLSPEGQKAWEELRRLMQETPRSG